MSEQAKIAHQRPCFIWMVKRFFLDLADRLADQVNPTWRGQA